MSGAFAKTTFGPPAPTGQDTNKGALIADVQTGLPEIVDNSGTTHQLHTTAVLLAAQTALATITTAQNVASLAFLARALNKVGRALRLTGSMIFSTAVANTPTIAIALKLGSVTLCTLTSAAVVASITNGQIQFEFIANVVTAGSAGTLESHGSLFSQLSATLSTALAGYGDQNTAVSSAVDLTAAQTLTVTITAAGGTVSSAQLRQLLIEVVG